MACIGFHRDRNTKQGQDSVRVENGSGDRLPPWEADDVTALVTAARFVPCRQKKNVICDSYSLARKENMFETFVRQTIDYYHIPP